MADRDARLTAPSLIGDPPLLLRALQAYHDLAIRLWCGDMPGRLAELAEIDGWANGLPEDQHVALNAMLGEGFGRRYGWDEDHPISRLVVQINEVMEADDGT